MSGVLDLLQHTSLPIKEIGLQVGIPDVNYLSRLFRQRFGVSPRQYRAKGHRRLRHRLARAFCPPISRS
ncbi:MAG: AraC family transcriptional regulator [Verrucomicrobia bacterium]|nr:AraC family transcriptional regulator [Verrucomicrobiota bacterium]